MWTFTRKSLATSRRFMWTSAPGSPRTRRLQFWKCPNWQRNSRAPHRRIGARELRCQFGHFQNCNRLVLGDPGADVHINLLDVASDFRVNVHILKWLKSTGQRQGSSQFAARNLDHRGDGFSASLFRGIRIVCFRLSVRHPAHNAISPKRTRPATIRLFLFDIACPCYDRRLRTVRKVHPCRCSEEGTLQKQDDESGFTGSLLFGPALTMELRQGWGPRPDFECDVRLRYFYFSLEPPGHVTSCRHRDFFTI